MIPLNFARWIGWGLALTLFFFYLRRNKDAFKRSGLRKWVKATKRITRRAFFRKIGVGLLFAGIAFVLIPRASIHVEEQLGPVIEDPGAHPITHIYAISPWLLLAFGLLMPIFEEWLFRGVIFKRLLEYNWRGRKYIAIAVSSTLFGLMHVMNPGSSVWMALPTIAAGALFCAAYLHGGLLGATVGHSGYNGLMWLLTVI